MLQLWSLGHVKMTLTFPFSPHLVLFPLQEGAALRPVRRCLMDPSRAAAAWGAAALSGGPPRCVWARESTASAQGQKQDWELTLAQIMNSSLPNSDLN